MIFHDGHADQFHRNVDVGHGQIAFLLFGIFNHFVPISHAIGLKSFVLTVNEQHCWSNIHDDERFNIGNRIQVDSSLNVARRQCIDVLQQRIAIRWCLQKFGETVQSTATGNIDLVDFRVHDFGRRAYDCINSLV